MPYFGYEQQQFGSWAPVVFHDIPPTLHVTTAIREAIVEHTPWQLIDTAEAALSLSVLQKLYPLDADKLLKNETIRRNEEERKRKMVRPVEGFLTTQGKWFDTEAKANLYETNVILREVISEEAKNFLKTTDVDEVTDAVTAILDLIKAHHVVVMEYVNAVREVIKQTELRPDEAESQGGNGVGGQTTTDNSSDGTPVWELEGSPVVDETTTKTTAVSDGEGLEPSTVPLKPVSSKRRRT